MTWYCGTQSESWGHSFLLAPGVVSLGLLLCHCVVSWIHACFEKDFQNCCAPKLSTSLSAHIHAPSTSLVNSHSQYLSNATKSPSHTPSKSSPLSSPTQSHLASPPKKSLLTAFPPPPQHPQPHRAPPSSTPAPHQKTASPRTQRPRHHRWTCRGTDRQQAYRRETIYQFPYYRRNTRIERRNWSRKVGLRRIRSRRHP